MAKSSGIPSAWVAPSSLFNRDRAYPAGLQAARRASASATGPGPGPGDGIRAPAPRDQSGEVARTRHAASKRNHAAEAWN